jgi:hypothetical protein
MPQVYAAKPRKQFLRKEPRVCKICGRVHGVDNVKVELDHIDHNIHNNDFSNFQWLCQEHHMIKHGRMAWGALNFAGISRSDSAETIQRTLAKNNPHSREQLENMSTVYLRKAVAKAQGWHRGQSTPAQTIPQTKHVTIEIRGIRVEIPYGETVRIL